MPSVDWNSETSIRAFRYGMLIVSEKTVRLDNSCDESASKVLSSFIDVALLLWVSRCDIGD